MKSEHVVATLVGILVFVGVTSGVYITLVGAEDTPHLKTVPTTVENLNAYSASVMAIFSKYKDLTDDNIKKGASSEALSTLYHRAAVELLNLSVPTDLLDTHTQLVDTYLNNERQLKDAKK
ncbi:hypothetical protein KW790_01335 [Candidatus Parcubacteria bacterium]|nr:hypothetical protein [Candidatus Parcubacteria bacterium]